LTGKQDISFSPDARHILFTGMENGKKYVYRMPLSITYGTAPLINSAGLPVKLTAGTNDNYNPAFSPDGDAVAFISTRNQAPELWMMNADGTNQRKIIFASSVPVNPAFPQFSPCDSSIIAYLSGTPSRIYTVDISQEFKSGIEISPALTTTGRFSWAKSPSGNIEIERHKVFGTYYPDIPLEYNISVAINRKQMPASFLVEETVPETWILTDVKINGTAPPSTEITSWGDRKTMRWLFGGGGIAVGDSVIELAFALNGDTVGNSYWLTGGATVSDRKYLTAGDSHLTIGEPCMPVDSDENWLIDDFELLNSIDMWAQNIQVKGWPADTEDWDFWLLSIINFWANNNGYRYKTGGTQPDWEPVP
jgi:hypothetical protein